MITLKVKIVVHMVTTILLGMLLLSGASGLLDNLEDGYSFQEITISKSMLINAVQVIIAFISYKISQICVCKTISESERSDLSNKLEATYRYMYYKDNSGSRRLKDIRKQIENVNKSKTFSLIRIYKYMKIYNFFRCKNNRATK